MFAIRQIIDNPQEAIPVPPEMRHRPTEVIFIALDAPVAVTPGNELAQSGQPADDPIGRFCGSCPGGARARLLAERQADLEREG
jgi:hypothetical protein